jgi:hypothetical protein
MQKLIISHQNLTRDAIGFFVAELWCRIKHDLRNARVSTDGHTEFVVYVNRPRLTNCSVNFPISTDAARDIAENWYVLSFVRPDGAFGDHQVTLQTGAQAKTGIAIKTVMPDAFYQFQTSWLRRVLGRPKYFTLE